MAPRSIFAEDAVLRWRRGDSAVAPIEAALHEGTPIEAALHEGTPIEAALLCGPNATPIEAALHEGTQHHAYNMLGYDTYQWLAWAHPDPDNAQYKCVVEGLKTVGRLFGWSAESMMIWLDYHSIPQDQTCSSSMRGQAISSLPIYASLSSIFVVVAPRATHSGTGLTCDQDTYHRRLWCRVELFSHYFRRGRDAMYLLQEDQVLASVDQSWLLDALFVFEGDCTCCLRKHEGMKCDKPLVRDLMLGLYAEVLYFKKKDESHESRRCREIYDSMEQNKDRVFPMSFSTEFTIKSSGVLGAVVGAGSWLAS